MSQQDFKELKAGRELDALVAEKVMGWRWRATNNGYEKWNTLERPPFAREKGVTFGKFPNTKNINTAPHYSTEISEAWEVVEKLVKDGMAPGLLNDDFGSWALVEDGMQEAKARTKEPMTYFCEEAIWCKTPPLAICLAALAAVRERQV